MPFRSEAQRRFMFAKHPEIAKRWADTYGTPSNLPMHSSSHHSGGDPMNAHPGFEGAAQSVASRSGLPMDRARAIIAAGARKASPAARRANPRLNRVTGVGKAPSPRVAALHRIGAKRKPKAKPAPMVGGRY